MSDDGRLELDDAGRVVDAGNALTRPTDLTDLADPSATAALSVTPLDSWAERWVGPWMSRHRTALRVTAATVAVAVVGVGWWTSRPQPPPEAPLLTLENAPTRGGDLGGPRFDDDGTLLVAYNATASPSVTGLTVFDLVGPGLDPGGVDRGASSLVGGSTSFVQLRAHLRCDDAAIATAGASSYGLRIQLLGADAASVTTVPFGPETTALDVAVRNRCVAAVVPHELALRSIALQATPGTSIVDVAMVVGNDSGVATTIATERTATTGIEWDLSPTVTIAPHTTATLTTRFMLHDCGPAALPASLGSLPNPVLPAAPGDSVAPGVTLRVGIGDQTALASYPLPTDLGSLQAARDMACTGRPALTTHLDGLVGQAQPGSGWSVTGVLTARTTGVGVTVGREHFSGPPTGVGSVLVTTDTVVPGATWLVGTAAIDGGAGRVPVTFSGASCLGADAGIPDTLAVHVITADHGVYPFELPLDRDALRRAVADACGSAITVRAVSGNTTAHATSTDAPFDSSVRS
jgi:hypothetical protein